MMAYDDTKDMIKKYITGGLFVFLLILAFWGGWKAHARFRPCPEVQRDTIRIYDTVTKIIPDTIPWYIVRKDTIIINHNIPAIVDTSAILADHYNFHYYTRDWYDITSDNDTIIHINQQKGQGD